MKINKFYIAVAFIIAAMPLFAQEGNTQNYMRFNPYSNSSNPAHFTPYNGYFGFPALSNFNLSLTNTAFRYRKLFATDSRGYPVTLTADKFVNSLKKNGNWLNIHLNEEILGFGFRIDRLFFSVSFKTKIDGYLRFSKDLFAFPIKGNMLYLGENNPADISIDASVNAYQELSLGIQAEVTPRLYLGFRPRLLMGIANFHTKALQAKIFTDPTDYGITLNYNADMIFVAALPIHISADNNLELITEPPFHNAFRNFGFAMDLGGVYRINDHMGVGLSLTDFGFIRWKTQGVRAVSQLSDQGSYYQNGNFYFNGLTSQQIADLIDNENYLNEFLDTVAAYFPLELESFTGRTTYLNAKLGAEFYYQINPRHRFTAHFEGSILGKRFFPRMTLAYNANLGNNIVDLCAHYTIMPHSYGNIGFGLGLNLWPVYLYFTTGNLLSYVTPLSTKHINFQFGLVFKWGKVFERPLSDTNY